ncbi:MAG: hypothetical protein E7619_02860 [Ruminococcaceae bacterium]|nr:hypothetical protein [Oscillospiraceae bacterium]
MRINGSVISRLAELYGDKKISQKLLFESVKSFSDLGNAVFCLKCKTAVFSSAAMGEDAYSTTIVQAEKAVISAKKAVTSAVIALNRMAERAELEPVYEGDANDVEALYSAVLDYYKNGIA